MFLDQILAACGFPAVAGDVEITGITSDSRKVEKGFLFAALPGSKTNGTDFYRTLMKRGRCRRLSENGLRSGSADDRYFRR